MTPEQKAIQLVEKYGDELKYYIDDNRHVLRNNARDYAIICCNELLNQLHDLGGDWTDYDENPYKYWQQVKTFIQKL
jgi:hypothetical protein